MARPKKSKTLTAVSMRFPKAMLDQIDEAAEILQEDTPLLEITRTEAVRYLVALGWNEFEKKYGLKKRTKKVSP